jgi:hypothetical protein
LVEREDAGDERLDLDFLACQEVEEALQVAPLGPADITRRLVLPMSTMRARSLANFAAVSTGPLEEPPAARNM